MSTLFDLAPTKEIIRTLGLYQPFASLMLHGKIETRWCRVGKKPSFPLGKYVLYSTKKPYDGFELVSISGGECLMNIPKVLKDDKTKNLNGYTLGLFNLVKIEPMTKEMEAKCFVNYKPPIQRKDKKGVTHKYQLMALHFELMEAFEQPEVFRYGKQGVGILQNEPF